MNPDTGRIYYGQEEIDAAKERGESLIELRRALAEELSVARPAEAEPDEETRRIEAHRRLEAACREAMLRGTR